MIKTAFGRFSFSPLKKILFIPPTNTICQMIVNEPRSLQMGVANRGPEEFKTPLFMSLLMASDSGEDAGISLKDRTILTTGFPDWKKTTAV